ncbi:MAG: hypothetical protein HY437_02485 [Candidatus Magasanikbacteria bacterium]|nr:hypothetical protein [Candidatus Magasanikbacteria bacterium]
MKLLLTRPEHDVTTRYLSCWAKEIIVFAKKKGVSVFDLSREKANREEFVGRLKKISPEVVFLNGHGSDTAVAGHDDEVLVETEDNEDVLAEKITYALSCNSGKVLGQKVTKNKNTTYIGYSDGFIFVGDRNYLSRPTEDPKARPFMESSNQVMISLLKGHSAKDASKRSKNAFKERYTALLASTSDQDSLQAAQCLRWNMNHQVCLGDGQAKLGI